MSGSIVFRFCPLPVHGYKLKSVAFVEGLNTLPLFKFTHSPHNLSVVLSACLALHHWKPMCHSLELQAVG